MSKHHNYTRFKQFWMLWFGLYALSLLGWFRRFSRYPLTSLDKIGWRWTDKHEKLKLQCLQCRRAPKSCSPAGPCCLCIKRGCATPWWFGNVFKAGSVSKGSRPKILRQGGCNFHLDISGDTWPSIGPGCAMQHGDERWTSVFRFAMHHSSFWSATKC